MHLAFAAELPSLGFFHERRCSAVGLTRPDCNCFPTLLTPRISETIWNRS